MDIKVLSKVLDMGTPYGGGSITYFIDVFANGNFTINLKCSYGYPCINYQQNITTYESKNGRINVRCINCINKLLSLCENWGLKASIVDNLNCKMKQLSEYFIEIIDGDFLDDFNCTEKMRLESIVDNLTKELKDNQRVLTTCIQNQRNEIERLNMMLNDLNVLNVPVHVHDHEHNRTNVDNTNIINTNDNDEYVRVEIQRALALIDIE